MKYFTPRRYIRCNSVDEAEAARADDEWEQVIEEYELYLKRIGDRLPSPLKKLTQLYQHDARILSRPKETISGDFSVYDASDPSLATWKAIAVLPLKIDDTIRNLIYTLWDRVRVQSFKGDWPFSKEAEHWMYDELDSGPDGRDRPLHRILLSSGTELVIPFTSVIVQEFPLPRPVQKALA